MFSISFCLYRACFTHLISSNLSCNLCLWYWFTKIKKSMQTYIVIVSGSILNVSTVHLNGIWHLIWRYLLKPVLGGHPVLSEHYSIPWGCPLNTGFTVFIWNGHSVFLALFSFLFPVIFFWPFHHSKTSSSFFCGLFLGKTRKRKKYNNKGCQEIIGLILFGKNPKITATHRNVVV